MSAAGEYFSRAGHEAIDGILDMAPALLEAEIRKLVKQHGHERGFAYSAAEALAEIDTATSRAELIDWFDRSDDLQIRSSIVNAVARARHPDNLPFLASLLPGRSTQVDNRLRRDAALGIGMIGGETAVEALRAAPLTPDPLVAAAVLLALGNTQSKSAIPILIERAKEQKGYVSNDVCTALIALTHLSWCGGVGLEETQKKWRTWWAANAKDVRAYSPDGRPDRSSLPNSGERLTWRGAPCFTPRRSTAASTAGCTPPQRKSSEGLRPSDSPTVSLTRGAALAPFAWLVRCAHSRRRNVAAAEHRSAWAA